MTMFLQCTKFQPHRSILSHKSFRLFEGESHAQRKRT
jgi:hypothetical protein